MKHDILSRARDVILSEADAVRQLADKVNGSFLNAVEAVLDCKGKVIVTGMGKSGIVGRKLVATFNSTGTPAIYLHPAEGLHGDLGTLQKDDLVIAISKSGNLDEFERFYPVLERLGVKIIAITGNLDSPLAKRSLIALDVSVPSEACSHNLAPTSSSTAAMALGDALAVVVQEERGFTAEDFKMLHPGGTLGRQLTLHVKDLMHSGDDLPVVNLKTPVPDMLVVMTNKRLGSAVIADDGGKLVGMFTDGDLRRSISSKKDFLSRNASDVMTPKPRTIDSEALAVTALRIMEERKITALVVVDNDHKPVGLIHIHDILRSKVV